MRAQHRCYCCCCAMAANLGAAGGVEFLPGHMPGSMALSCLLHAQLTMRCSQAAHQAKLVSTAMLSPPMAPWSPKEGVFRMCRANRGQLWVV